MRKLLFILIVAALSLPACSQAAAPTTTAPGRARTKFTAAELEISDPAQPIEVKAGSEFTITVATVRSQVLHWEVAEALNESIVQYVWKDHVSDDPLDPSSTGRDIWRFKGVAPGKTTITLGYYPGESADTSQKAVFTVVVK